MWSKYLSSNGNIKCPVGNSTFAENLHSKLFRATVANADTESLRILHTLFDTYLDHMLAKFEPNRIARIAQNFELFDRNLSFLRPFSAKAKNVPVAKTSV